MASGNKGIRQRAQRAEEKRELDKRVVTGMANSLRTQMLVILNERAASAIEMARELGVPYNRVSYEMGVLKKAGLVELKAEERVRGAVKLFYRATKGPYIDESEWPAVPDALKGGLRGSLLETLIEDAVAAISQETFDSMEEAHMSWTPLIVDDRGWWELAEVLRRALDEVLEVKDRSAERLTAENAKGISCTVSMLGYPSPNENRRVEPPIDTAVDKKQSRSKKKSRKKG